MGPSTFKTYTVPGPWPVSSGVVIVRAPRSTAIRAVVRNLGDGTLWIALDQIDVIGPSGPSANTFRLPAGEVDVYVLASDQKLFAVGDAPGIQVSVAINEAFPMDGGKLAL